MLLSPRSFRSRVEEDFKRQKCRRQVRVFEQSRVGGGSSSASRLTFPFAPGLIFYFLLLLVAEEME